MRRSGGLLTKYLFGVCMGQADCRPNICLVYEGIRQIVNRILIRCMHGSGGLRPNMHWCMRGSGGLSTEYSLGVCMGQANCDQIFIWCMQGSGGLPTEYLFSV